MLHVVAYDISSDRRRRKAASILEGLGTRLQRSVFLVDDRTIAIPALLVRMAMVIQGRTDRVDVFPLCARCADGARSAGQPSRQRDADPASPR